MNRKNDKRFRVAVGDPNLFSENLNTFNRSYRTNFSISSLEDLDGVEFAYVDMNDATLDDIFLLGAKYEGVVNSKRKKGEIDF